MSSAGGGIPIVHYPGLYYIVAGAGGRGIGGHGVVASGGGLPEPQACMDKVRVYEVGLEEGYLSTVREVDLSKLIGESVAVGYPARYSGHTALLLRRLNNALHLVYYDEVNDEIAKVDVDPSGSLGAEEATMLDNTLVYLKNTTIKARDVASGSEVVLGSRSFLSYAILDKLYVCTDDSIKALTSVNDVTDHVTMGGPYACGVVKGNLAYIDASTDRLTTVDKTYTLPDPVSFSDVGLSLSLSDAWFVTCGGRDCQYIVVIFRRSGRFYVVYFDSGASSVQPTLLKIANTYEFLFAYPILVDYKDTGVLVVGV